MEEVLLAQSMDSLWFFSSVFSPPKTNPKLQSLEMKTDLEEEPEKPISPIPRSDQNEQPAADLGAETEKLLPELGNADEEEEDRNIAAEKVRRRKRRRRRKVLGELDLGFSYERCNGLGICGIRGDEWVKMPPLSDGVAMKEHIKCWAHAVACTVR